MKCLIIYFSRSGENFVNGEIVSLSTGNTKKVVDLMASVCEWYLFEVETQHPYSDNYKACVKTAMKE
jgi:flavodoxin